MTETDTGAPGMGASAGALPLPDIVAGLIAEAEATSRRITALRAELEAAELARRKLIVALDAAAEALPAELRRAHEPRLAALAAELAPPRGRRPDSRLSALIERLAWLSSHNETVVKVAELTAHLVRRGYRNMAPGYVSNALAGLAERGLVSRHSHGRWRIHEWHPELVELRMRYIHGLVHDARAYVRDLHETERLGHKRNLGGR